MNQYTVLYYFCSLAGLIMIVGGIWLIYKEKIFLDSTTKQVIQVDLPFFGKLRTNVPALVLFFLGFAALFYPIAKIQTSYLHVRGSVASQLHPVVVYAAVQSQFLPQDGSFDVPLPIVQSGDYTPLLLYVAGSNPTMVLPDPLDIDRQKKGVILLLEKKITGVQQAGRFQPDVVDPPSEFRP